MSIREYLTEFPPAIADLFVTVVALVTLAGAIFYARSHKNEPDEPKQPAGAWPPAPKTDR